MQPPSKGPQKIIITAVTVLVAVALIFFAKTYAGKHNPSSVDSRDVSPTAQDSEVPPATDSSATYKDGSYSASSTYQSPGGTEGITVKVTITNNIVTASTVTSKPTEIEAKAYQDMFIGGYKAKVVGKAVNSIHLSRVSGSSLTSEGFNNALAKIKQQAKA